MTSNQIEKRLSELEKQVGTDGSNGVERPESVVFVAAMPDGSTWPERPYNREDFHIRTAPGGPEWWHPNDEMQTAAIDRYQRILEAAQKVD